MDELIKQPHSLEAEQAVVGSMLVDSRCIPDVIELINTDDFYISSHKDIFDALYSLFIKGELIDPVIVLNEMRSRGTYKETSRDYFAKLLDATPTAAHVKHYSDIVKQQALLRQVLIASSEISQLVHENSGDANLVLDCAEQKIYDIRQGREHNHLYEIPKVLVDVYKNIKDLSESGGRIPGLETGIGELDQRIGGLANSNLILIGARPGMGKTSIAMNMALGACKNTGKAVVFFSLEMSKEQLVTRMLSSEAKIESNKLLTGSLSTNDWTDLAQTCSRLSKLKFLFDDNPAITVAEMKAKCRRVKNIGLIVIDYLQLMSGSNTRRSDNRTTEVSEISRSLKIMAKELNVPVICLSQLSRESEKRKENKRPMLSDLRESGAIEQDADCVMFIYRDDYYNPESEEKDVAEIIIAKNRHGETGTVKLTWNGKFTTFSALDKVHQE